MERQVLLKVFVVLLVVFSFSLFISACSSARQCFTAPCYEGDGLSDLWSVHDGEGFQVVITSMLVLAHSVVAYHVLFRSYSDLKYGMLLSVTGTIAFLMLVQSATWGVKASMIDDLDEHLNGSRFYQQNAYCDTYNHTMGRDSCESLGKSCFWVETRTADTPEYGCYRGMVANSTAKRDFSAVLAFSILLFLTNAAFFLVLSHSKNEFGAKGGFSQAVDAATAQAQAEDAATPGYSGYQ